MSDHVKSKPRRRWIFTTTRGLLVLTLLCSAVLAYRAHKVKRYHTAVRALKAKGVDLGDPYFDYFGPDIVLDYIFHNVLNMKFGIYLEMPDFLRLDTYTWVMMETPGVSDDVAEHLRHLHGVNRLDIHSDSPDAEPAENLRQIRVTSQVTLMGPWIDEDAIRAASRIPGLPRRGDWSDGVIISAANDKLSEELREYLEACPIRVDVGKWKKHVISTPSSNSPP